MFLIEAADIAEVRELIARDPFSSVGVLVMPGVTAWLELADLAPPGPTDTVLVSVRSAAAADRSHARRVLVSWPRR